MKLRIAMDVYPNWENMKAENLSLEAVKRGVVLRPDSVVDGFVITTDIEGFDCTSDFFLEDAKIVAMEIVKGE